MSTACALAGFCLGAAAVLRARRWNAVLLSVPVLAVAALHSMVWVVRPVRVVNLRSRALPWLNGAGIGLALTIVVGGLLASADSTFAAALQAVSSVFGLHLVTARVISCSAVPRWCANLRRRTPNGPARVSASWPSSP